MVVFLGAGAMLPAGCSEEPKPQAAPPAQQAKPIEKPKTEAPKIEEKTEPVYTYNPAGRRDPFMPIISKEEKKAKTGDLPPLERYNITDFKLAGIIWGGFGYNAMLEGPDGKGYFIRVGTIVGPNKGVVKKITQNRMVIEEKYRTATGDIDRREIVVELQRKREGKP